MFVCVHPIFGPSFDLLSNETLLSPKNSSLCERFSFIQSLSFLKAFVCVWGVEIRIFQIFLLLFTFEIGPHKFYLKSLMMIFVMVILVFRNSQYENTQFAHTNT